MRYNIGIVFPFGRIPNGENIFNHLRDYPVKLFQGISHANRLVEQQAVPDMQTIRREREAVTDVVELQSLLGEHFVILFGSAISGVMEPKLPMIDNVTHTFLGQASTRLYKSSYRDQVIAGYAHSLVNGYHNSLLSRTKFENFIYDLQGAVGKHAVDDLFVRIFSCRNEQYNCQPPKVSTNHK